MRSAWNIPTFVKSCRALAPDVIDVNSSLETSPGVKSEALLARFLEKARALWCAHGNV